MSAFSSAPDPGALLKHLIRQWEGETVEFKNVGDSYSTSDIGKYFSALANEANLRNLERGWLIFGVENSSRRVVGTEYRSETERLHGLKRQIAQGSEPSITFREIHVFNHEQGRVILFEIPAAPFGIPVAWNGHYYARAGESLTALGLDKLDAIRNQSRSSDWSAQVVPLAGIHNLEPEALAKAREGFAFKYANRFSREEIFRWPDSVFLDRAKITYQGALTRAALLLLGKAESSHFLSPHPAEITWKLEGPERAYQHFSTPFLLNSGSLYQKIRNIQLRILPEDQLVPIEVAKYDQKIFLEALHNCIAHQDYARNGRILVTEWPDKLVLENDGGFYEGVPEDYVLGLKTPRHYRNPCLAQAMVELNMIDTMGYGIHGMFQGQAKRFFPLPDYDLSSPRSVRMTLHGKIVDPAYSRLLIQKTDLSLAEIQALDRVQKRLPLEENSIRQLRRSGLIEGRKPNIHVSAHLAAATGAKAQYIRNRNQDDTFYQKLITDYLERFGSAGREELDKLLFSKLPDGLTPEQKTNKIHNLLGKLKRDRVIVNQGSKAKSNWELVEAVDPKVSKKIKDLSKKSSRKHA